MLDRRKVESARRGLPAPDVVRDAVDVFKVLASPVRISIVHALTHDELSVGDLAHALGISLSVTSHQLALLRRMKLVRDRQQGRVTFYRVIDDFVGALVHDCLAHIDERLGQGPSHHHAVATSRYPEKKAPKRPRKSR